MKHQIAALAIAAGLASCATGPGTGSSAQADFDRACKYANGVLSAAEPIIPIAQGLIQAKFGNDSSLAFQSFVSTVKTTCGKPLDLANAAAITQRIYDAGGHIVALIVQSQAGQ